MAVSIVNTLTSRLWKGEPTVVIRGKFVLGLVASGDSAYFAPNLLLSDAAYLPMAVPLVDGTSISIQVLGCRGTDGAPFDSPVFSTPGWFGGGAVYPFNGYKGYTGSDADNWQQTRALFPADPYDNSAAGPFFAPKVYFHPSNQLSNTGFPLTEQGETNAYYVTSDLGRLVSSDLRVVLRGPLSSLDVTRIKAVGFPPDGSDVGYKAASDPWYSQRYYSRGNEFSPAGVGWRPVDVRIYDNPALRGHVTSGDVPVLWG